MRYVSFFEVRFSPHDSLRAHFFRSLSSFVFTYQLWRDYVLRGLFSIPWINTASPYTLSTTHQVPVLVPPTRHVRQMTCTKLFIDILLSSQVSGVRKGAMLVIRDALDGIFGGWIGKGLRLHQTGEGHFGGEDL
jgi:hypothetical protein